MATSAQPVKRRPTNCPQVKGDRTINARCAFYPCRGIVSVLFILLLSVLTPVIYIYHYDVHPVVAGVTPTDFSDLAET